MRGTSCAMAQEWDASWSAKRNRKSSVRECSWLVAAEVLRRSMIFTHALESTRKDTQIDSVVRVDMNNLKGARITRSFFYDIVKK